MGFQAKILILAALTVLQGCSPFGGDSLVERINHGVDNIFSAKSTSGVVAGSDVLETDPALPANNYKVSVVVGGQLDQPYTVTGGGYKVYTEFSDNQ